MNLKERRAEFEKTKTVYASAKLTFHGVDGYDVYNTSTPFEWQGRMYLFGRVERRADWARSTCRLFVNTGADDWTVVPEVIYPLEDPSVAWIGGQLVLVGTHVRHKPAGVDTYYAYFYRGSDPRDLEYFATGPNFMKDVRLVQLADGQIGVFSRPRNAEIMQRFGCESQIGFTVIDTLDELLAETIENAPYIPGVFGAKEWGGCNQAHLLADGRIGVIAHQCYLEKDADGVEQQVYMNTAFVYNREKHVLEDFRIIGTRPCYPASTPKMPFLKDCAFTSGITLRPDGKADLYSGLSDTAEGRIVTPNPFTA